MPDPETEISAQSRGEELPDLEGPADDDAEAHYDPDAIEVSRGRELGLGVGARDLQMQNDVEGSGGPTLEGDVERIDSDTPTAADSLTGDDASDLGVDEEFDSEDQGEDAERQDDRATFRGVPESDYRRP